MFQNREKNGSIEVNWREVALGKKYDRKIIGVGAFDEEKGGYEHKLFIRELCVATGALGCAIWDGGVILARWIYDHPERFVGQRVLELGSGCGIGGIAAARFAVHVTLTDYLLNVNENIAYNVGLNSGDADEDVDEDEDVPRIPRNHHPGFQLDISPVCTVGFLDWDKIDSAPPSKDQLCTRLSEGKGFIEQEWFKCDQCHVEEGSGCCASCAAICHKSHIVKFVERSRFKCDCFDSDVCKASNPANIVIDPVDVIIGAELTYNLLSVQTLARVVDRYLKPNGVFYEVLSEDRDGVTAFLDCIQQLGFDVEVMPAPLEYYRNFNTRTWSQQSAERYRIFAFRRKPCIHPPIL